MSDMKKSAVTSSPYWLWLYGMATTTFIGFIILFSICRTLNASSGASFLKLGVGARALGLGSAYTAVANDVTALHWNPAGLSQIEKREVGAMHAELFADSRYDFFGYAHPTANGTFGIGAIYLSQGSLEGRSADRMQTVGFTASDLSITLGASRLVTKQASLGINMKLLQSKIAGLSSSGFAFDMGSTYQFEARPLSLGFAIQNVGPKMKFLDEGFNLPLTFATGAGYQLMKSILISADLKHQPYDSRTTFSVGTEFSPVSILSL